MEKETTGWSDIADSLVNTWSETGTQIWKSWYTLMGAVPTREAVADTKPEAKYVAQRFVDNQELLTRLLQLSFNAWQEIWPKVEAGEDWQQVLSKYSSQMRQQIEDFSVGTLKASQDVAQLWQLYIKEMQKFNQLWATSLETSWEPISKTVTGTPQPWLELNNLYWNLLYEETFGSLMRSPILGPSREFNNKLLRTFDTWNNLYQASINYQVVLADVQLRSFEQLMWELISLAEKDEKVEDWRQFQQLWSRVADEVFEQEFCSEDNLKIRGKFLNALNTYKLQQQELMELWLKTMNLPVRSEVDEVHKNIYELRKEVKILKKRSEVDEVNQSIDKLRQEVETLKKALAKYEATDSETLRSDQV